MDLLRLATAGSVDDGKSTLIGRLLYDSKEIMEDQLQALERSSRLCGGDAVNLALLTDGLRAERQQGITIDVAYRYFSTPRRKFILADTPGHVQYTRNMVTGASNADVAVLLVDARRGLLEQSRRHAFISTMLGIQHIVVCINKMDLVDWDEGLYENINDQFRAFASRLNPTEIEFVPMSALYGDNVVARSRNMPWYEGLPLLPLLEELHIGSRDVTTNARFAVQRTVRCGSSLFGDYRGYAGRVIGGVLRPGDEVVVLPSGVRTRIAAIDRLGAELAQAFAPMCVTVRLEDEIDVSRGDMICQPRGHPQCGDEIEALVCWFTDRPLSPGKTYYLKHTTRWARVIVRELRYRVDTESLEHEGAASLSMNDIGHVRFRTTVPLMFDDYRTNRATGSFILVDEATNGTAGAGIILGRAA